MKSITNQYKDLKEGKMSQANFMRNVRMTFPHLVTNVMSFNDSVKILKNKGLLHEHDILGQLYQNTDLNLKESIFENEENNENIDEAIKILELEKNDLLHTNPMDKDPEIVSDQIDEINAKIADLKAKKAGLEEAYPEDEVVITGKGKPAYGYKNYTELSNAIDKAIDSGKISPEELEAASKKAETDATELALLLVKAFLAEAKGSSGKEQYADFNEVDNLNAQEILIGIDCELQMNPELSKEKATDLVIKNLKKDPNYYTNYALAGKEAKAEYMYKYKEGSDQMKPVKGEDSLVDKDNGMKSPKDIEKVKASAAKANKETNKVVKGVEYMKLTAKTVRGVKRMNATGEKMKKVNVKESLKTLIKQMIAEELKKK